MLSWLRNLGRRRYLIRIVFKGGTHVDIWCYSFNVNKRPGAVVSLTYDVTLHQGMFYTDLDAVAGVYQMDMRGWHR